MFECKTGRIDGQTPPCISTQQRCDSIRDCLEGEDELSHSCLCEPEGAIRLVGGSGLHEGRVEFCRKSMWVNLCNRYNRWGTRTSAVVCRQLGHSTQGEKYVLIELVFIVKRIHYLMIPNRSTDIQKIWTRA